MEMDNKLFKQNNADQVKGNATKLEYTSYHKNINGSPSFIQKFLIQNQTIHNFSEQRKITFVVNFSLIQNKRK